MSWVKISSYHAMSISYNLASSNSRRGVLTILPSDLEKVLASIPIVLQCGAGQQRKLESSLWSSQPSSKATLFSTDFIPATTFSIVEQSSSAALAAAGVVQGERESLAWLPRARQENPLNHTCQEQSVRC